MPNQAQPPAAQPPAPPPTGALPVGDFQALPLDFIISAPLLAVVRAQRDAALSTRDFITSLMTKDANDANKLTPMAVNFDLQYHDGETNKEIKLDVPLLSIVPIPHMRFDSITTHFKYEISQIVGTKRDNAAQGALDAGIKYLPFLDASLKGSLSTTSSEQSTTNRSGALEITVHASEAPIPEGLARLLSLLARAVPTLPPAD